MNLITSKVSPKTPGAETLPLRLKAEKTNSTNHAYVPETALAILNFSGQYQYQILLKVNTQYHTDETESEYFASHLA